MRIAFFGAYDPQYPRTRVLREGLLSRGAEVLEIGVDPKSGPGAREFGLIFAWLTRARRLDAILVPAFGHRDVPLGEILGRAADTPLLFDPLISRWDTQVHDLGRLREGSFGARRVRASDRLALSAADLVLCDTWEHGDFYSTQFRVPRRKLARIPVGADSHVFELGAGRARAEGSGPLEVVFVGSYLPLHGLPTIIEAAALLEGRHGAGLARFTLVGGGMLRLRVERDIAARGLKTVRLLPRTPYEESVLLLARADLSLGIFGTSGKAGRVVPHKVYESMALGVPVVTRRSAAIAEFFRDEEHLVLVPAGDAPALARAIEALAGDRDRRRRIAEGGRESAWAQASPGRIGDLLLEAVRRSREATAPGARR